MIRIALFGEDFGHEQYIIALIQRLGNQCGIEMTVKPYNVVGGHGKALSELRGFVNDIRRGRVGPPDILVVAIDANCRSYGDVKKEIYGITKELIEITICAVPDPHIERWMLIDSNAFKRVFDVGCNIPDSKCEKDRFKKILLNEIQSSGLKPQLGGMEFAEDIVNGLNLKYVGKSDQSLGNLINDLRDAFKRLGKT